MSEIPLSWRKNRNCSRLQSSWAVDLYDLLKIEAFWFFLSSNSYLSMQNANFVLFWEERTNGCTNFFGFEEFFGHRSIGSSQNWSCSCLFQFECGRYGNSSFLKKEDWDSSIWKSFSSFDYSIISKSMLLLFFFFSSKSHLSLQKLKFPLSWRETKILRFGGVLQPYNDPIIS